MNLDFPTSLLNRALAYQMKGCLERAEVIYRGLFRRNYQNARFYTNYGVHQYQIGNKDFGLRLFERALVLDPSYQDAWNNLRVDAELTECGDTLLRISTGVLSLFPELQPAMVAQGHGFLANSNYARAKKVATKALEVNPDDLILRQLIARCDLVLGDIDSALVHLLYILSLQPTDVFASIELSEIAAKIGDYDSVVSILETAYQANPQDYSLLLKLARTYQSMGSLHKAINMYEKGLAKFEDSPVFMGSMAYCYAEMGSIEKFLELYDRIIALGVERPELYVPLIFTCSTLGEQYLDRLREHSLLFWSLTSKQSQSETLEAPSITPSRVIDSVPFSQGPLEKMRLGIVTGDLGTHVVSSFLASFLLNYSKESFEVEIVSNQWRNDPVADVLSKLAGKCISIADYSYKAARKLLCSREYDVIIETSGFTSGSAMHLLADRCAPIQCHWIGYHASTYMPTMDYFIGDSILTPEAHSHHFTETVVRLGRAWLAATPFNPIPEAVGRPQGSEIVIGSFSQIAKLTETTLSLWSSILTAAPRVKLLLKDRFTSDEMMRKRLVDYFKGKGVDSERIIFKERPADWFHHMNMYNQIDIALDTTPWSSATTAFDALSMGVPLVGLRGQTTSGLMSTSILHHCGRSHWIAEDHLDYVEKCVSMVDNIHVHRKSRREFQAEILRSTLFDGEGMTLAIQQFLLRH
jgi:predicted O-linked N-acetylglucosamine transferase (SPINDLY family)